MWNYGIKYLYLKKWKKMNEPQCDSQSISKTGRFDPGDFHTLYSYKKNYSEQLLYNAPTPIISESNKKYCSNVNSFQN